MMNREKVDGWCEKGMLFLVLAILVFGPLATGAVRAADFVVLQALTVAVMLLWIVRLWVNEKPKLLWTPVCWAVTAFALLAVGRYLTCEIEYVGRQEMIRVLLYAFLFLVIVNNLHRQEHIQAIVIVLVFLAMAVSFYALYQYFTGTNRVWAFISPYKNRASGTYISPNHLAGFLEMILPLGMAYALAGRVKAPLRILMGYASLVILGGIAVTVSRGGWLSTIIVILLFFGVLLLHRKHRFPALVVLGVFALGFFFLLPKVAAFRLRFTKMFTTNELNENMRYSIWDPAWRIWRDNPVWGAGPGHFDSMFRAYRPQGVQLQPDWVHNDYLNTLTDWGVVGMGIVLAALVLLAFGVFRTWRAVRPQSSDFSPLNGSNKYAFVLGAGLGLTAIALHSWVDFNMHIPANAILCVSLMALLSSHSRFASERHWATAGVGLKLLLTIVLAGGGVYLGMQAWQSRAEAVSLARAAKEPAYSPAQIARLKEAFAADPMNGGTAYAIGESYRIQSFEGGRNYADLGAQALEWLQKATELDPWNGYGYLRYGMCLDWLGRTAEAEPYFDKAGQLDPNGYYSVAYIGIHHVHLGNYAAAKALFERSLKLNAAGNTIAQSYLQICNARLLEGATNTMGLTVVK